MEKHNLSIPSLRPTDTGLMSEIAQNSSESQPLFRGTSQANSAICQCRVHFITLCVAVIAIILNIFTVIIGFYINSKVENSHAMWLNAAYETGRLQQLVGQFVFIFVRATSFRQNNLSPDALKLSTLV